MIEKCVCPVCYSGLSKVNDTIFCLNDECKVIYKYFEGIPVLLKPTSSLNNSIRISKGEGILKRIVRKYSPTLSLNLSSHRNFSVIKNLLDSSNKRAKILIVGGATITSGTEILFKSNYDIFETDIYIGPRTMLIADVQSLPFSDNYFDLVVIQVVLEYVENPELSIFEAYRVLKNGGIVYSTLPYLQQTQSDLHDLYRWTPKGHKYLLRKFDIIDFGIFAGSGVALAWSLRQFICSFAFNKLSFNLLYVLSNYLFFWLKYFDYFFEIIGGYNKNGSSGSYLIGKKNE